MVYSQLVSNQLIICFGIFTCPNDINVTTKLPISYTQNYRIVLSKADGLAKYGQWGQAWVSTVSQNLDSFVSYNAWACKVQFISIGI